MKPIPNLVFIIGKESLVSHDLIMRKDPLMKSSLLSIWTPRLLPTRLSYDRVAMGSGEIRIEFPGGIITRFSCMAESHAAMQLLTQICGHHVLPEWYDAVLLLPGQDRYAQRHEFTMWSHSWQDGLRRPFIGDVFIFINCQRTTMKLLHAEDGGLVLYIKRLEEGTFRLPEYDQQSKSYSYGKVSYGFTVICANIAGYYTYNVPVTSILM